MKFETDSDTLLQTSYRDLWNIPQAEVDEFQLKLLQTRFNDLVEKVQALKKLASLQNVKSIDELNDVIPILFQHTAYKSYPMSYLEKGKFAQWTKWLDKLTAHDLSKIDTSSCQSIDDWLQLLDDQTPVRAVHSSGTSGKLSLIPRDLKEIQRFTDCRIRCAEGFGDEANTSTGILSGKKMPVIYPTYRYGRYGANRLLQDMEERYSENDKIYALHEEMMSADVISLAGRVAGAEARGELDALEIPDHLLEKYKASMGLRASQEEKEKDFLDRILNNCQGDDVVVLGVVPLLLEWVRMAKERGVERMFGPNSIILSGGGSKGITLPDDWCKQIGTHVGVEANICYGMSESITQLAQCPEGNYHITPYMIPFMLDPETGEPLPREGTYVGRFAFYDLLAESYWGGFITGDRVTAHWDSDCACGRHGFYVDPDIIRFSDLSDDGDDKINCAGAANAHERALEFLNEQAKNV